MRGMRGTGGGRSFAAAGVFGFLAAAPEQERQPLDEVGGHHIHGVVARVAAGEILRRQRRRRRRGLSDSRARGSDQMTK
eukprot:281592-Prorocentrum_minimum.AAC.1